MVRLGRYWAVAFVFSAVGCGKTSSHEPHGAEPNPERGGSDDSGGSDSSAGSGGSVSSLGGAGSGSKSDQESCRSTVPADPTRPGYESEEAVLTEVQSTLKSMPLESKLLQLTGLPNPPNRTGAVYRDIGRSRDADSGDGKTLRGSRFRDGGRGVNLVEEQDNRASNGEEYSTAFPSQSVRGASWDVDLEFRIGQAHGDETMASLNTVLRAPTLNVLNHPYWGQSQASYGEDTFHVGRMASAFIAGAQQHVLSCAVSFAASNVENSRSGLNAVVQEQALREVYGRQFEMAVREGGVGCVVAAYNLVNGQKSTQNEHLLTEVLRTDFGFRGVVISDLWAMPGDQSLLDTAQASSLAVEALNAGLDVELPWALHFDQLEASLAQGRIAQSDIDRAAGRVLEQKFRFGSQYTDGPYGLGEPTTALDPSTLALTHNEAHIDLAEEAEIKSAVLLTNGLGDARVLPVVKPRRIAVIGPERALKVVAGAQPPVTGTTLRFASDVNLGDRGQGRVNNDPASSVGPFDGIRAVAASHGVDDVVVGNSIEAAAGADLIVVVVGLHAGDEGEEWTISSRGDRMTLELPDGQAELVRSILDLDQPTAIFVESGSMVNLPWLSHSNQKQATIWAGYAGQRAGVAFGKLLFGDETFSGKLPFTWVEQADLPPFQGGSTMAFMDYFFGYRLYDALEAAGVFPIEPVFPFGHGLSYTTFEYSSLELPCAEVDPDSVLDVSVELENTGDVAGSEVVMLFVQGPPKAAQVTGERAQKELKGFARVELDANETRRVTIPLRIQDLRHWEGDENGEYLIDPGEYSVLVGPNSAELTLQANFSVKN